MHFHANRNVSMYHSKDWNSLFIPVLPKEYCTESALVNLIENELCIGHVEKVNIVKKKNAGFSHTIAFIHFHFWSRTEDTEFIRSNIESNGKCDIYGFFDKNNLGHPFQDSNGKPVYIRFVKYIAPPVIDDTPLMIAEKQILEQRVELNAQALRITALESQMKQMISILLQPVVQPSEYKPSILNTLPVETPTHLWKYNEDDYVLPPLRLEHLLDEEDDVYPNKLSILLPESEENTPWSSPPKAPRRIPSEFFIPEF